MQLQDIEQKLKDSGALPYLLSGGIGALAGGALAGRVKHRNESKLGRLGRILATGAASGAATAGTHKLLDYSLNQVDNALPVADVSPEQNLVSGTGTRAVAGGLAAAGITGMGHRADMKSWKDLSLSEPGIFASPGNTQHRNSILNNAAKGGNGNNVYRSLLDTKLGQRFSGDSSTLSPEDLALFNRREAIETQLRGLGINSVDNGRMMNARNKIVPIITKLTGRSPIGAAVRTAGVAAATMYPEILGAATNAVGEELVQ